ncbi:DUF4391 domain-containing protein [Sediminicola luteus]|uniref:DUF4391 domain-containing protein n=1 Tax=Sediminicola luteus TaxID=319238 RepID=A0A2A4G9G6_9FLAO|nr:DUF4391 domain-containing protein [Sediminicola luteus]PCE65083.1 hypothetical protein B7P33_07445 [Sediminicola luteus]
MEYFNLPETTRVNRVVPKNAFDKYTNSKQKKRFTDVVQRISWTNKLSKDTINLRKGGVEEIQLFQIELKVKDDIRDLLEIIDKSIPYPLVFILRFQKEVLVSCAKKHAHPINEDHAVVDWVFRSGWHPVTDKRYVLNLKKDLGFVIHDLCLQLSGRKGASNVSFENLIEFQQKKHSLENEITRLENAMAKAKQFNKKVDLNTQLIETKKELEKLLAI